VKQDFLKMSASRSEFRQGRCEPWILRFSMICIFLETNSILSLQQHVFRSQQCCKTQLILAIEDWAKALDSDFRFHALFDFPKTFHSVPHHRLLCKFESYSILDTTLSWIKVFLSNHNQPIVYRQSVTDLSPHRQTLSGSPHCFLRWSPIQVCDDILE